MPLVELRCPRCQAPVEAGAGPILRCGYCSASLLLRAPSPDATRTEHTVKLGRVGPSNRARVARELTRMADLSPADAEALVLRAPCDVVTWTDPHRAEALRDEIVLAGAEATIEERTVELPPAILVPARDVTLEDAGKNTVAVMKLLRDHLGVGLSDAKQLVASTPVRLAQNLEDPRATALRDALIAAGARATVD